GQGVCGMVLQDRKPQLISHVQASNAAPTAFIRALGVRAYYCCPLLVGKRLSGTLSFGSRSRDEFTPEDTEYLDTICYFIALAQERASYRLELEQRVAERTATLRSTVQELEHFSYTITHDMRAPLRALRAFGQILLEEAAPNLSEEHQDYLQRTVKAAQRMDLLIQDALNYSKLVHENFMLKPVDVGSLLEGIISSYPHFQQPNAEIQIIGRMPVVLGNEAALTQCFSNLMTNAVKFVAPGVKPRVLIRAEKGEGRVRFWFEDNGVGILPEHQERIFGMFERLSQSYEGTGIGLSLVRKAVQRMCGTVGVESALGAGSRFWIELCDCDDCSSDYQTSAQELCGPTAGP
ncbi:MAG: ATP-binding protein, partial [Limisphaerales bacterium]